MVAQFVIFSVVMISSYLKNIYLWSRKREKKKRSSVSRDSIIKSDIKLLKQKRIIKQKNEIVTFLKQYGLYIDKHTHYMMCSSDAKQIKEILSKEYPKLHVAFLENQKGILFLEIYCTKKECRLIRIEINNTQGRS